MAIEIVDFPIKNEVIVQFAMLVYQRVPGPCKVVGRLRLAAFDHLTVLQLGSGFTSFRRSSDVRSSLTDDSCEVSHKVAKQVVSQVRL